MANQIALWKNGTRPQGNETEDDLKDQVALKVHIGEVLRARSGIYVPVGGSHNVSMDFAGIFNGSRPNFFASEESFFNYTFPSWGNEVKDPKWLEWKDKPTKKLWRIYVCLHEGHVEYALGKHAHHKKHGRPFMLPEEPTAPESCPILEPYAVSDWPRAATWQASSKFADSRNTLGMSRLMNTHEWHHYMHSIDLMMNETQSRDPMDWYRKEVAMFNESSASESVKREEEKSVRGLTRLALFKQRVLANNRTGVYVAVHGRDVEHGAGSGRLVSTASFARAI